MIPADLHVHSRFSVDSTADVGALCEAAIARGLECIGFAEHVDLDPRDSGFGFLRFEDYLAALDDARRRYGGRIEILRGVEFAEPQLYPRELEQMQRAGLDYILGSVHWLPEGFVGDRALREQQGAARVFEVYYEALGAAVQHGGFDALAHLDLPKRYLGETVGLTGAVEEILGAIVQAGIALEINSSPLRKGLVDCAPDEEIGRRYAALGGRQVTFGSDAHAPEDVGAGCEAAASLAERVGDLAWGLFREHRFLPLNPEGRERPHGRL